MKKKNRLNAFYAKKIFIKRYFKLHIFRIIRFFFKAYNQKYINMIIFSLQNKRIHC